jgi:hypothetical protein
MGDVPLNVRLTRRRGAIDRARRAVQAAPVLPVARAIALPFVIRSPLTRLVRCAHIGEGAINVAPTVT